MMRVEHVVIIIVILCLIWLLIPKAEGFCDDYKTAFVPAGWPKYGLRGERLNVVPIDKYYLKENKHVRLSDTNNVMWMSNFPPNDEGQVGCQTVSCPTGLSVNDTCWKCPHEEYQVKIPDIHPHVGF